MDLFIKVIEGSIDVRVPATIKVWPNQLLLGHVWFSLQATGGKTLAASVTKVVIEFLREDNQIGIPC